VVDIQLRGGVHACCQRPSLLPEGRRVEDAVRALGVTLLLMVRLVASAAIGVFTGSLARHVGRCSA